MSSQPSLKTFEQLQQRLTSAPYLTADHTNKQRTIVYLTGLPNTTAEAEDITKAENYQERMLYVIGFLRNPRTSVIFVTAKQIDPAIIEYYFDLLSPSAKERASMKQRWHHFYIGNSKNHKTLAQKIITSKRVKQQIRSKLQDSTKAVLRCWNVSEYEQQLAEQLQIPLFANHSEQLRWESKSVAREIFMAAGVPPVYGHNGITSVADLVRAIRDIKKQPSNAHTVIIKLNNSHNGVRTAQLKLDKFPRSNTAAEQFVRKHLVVSQKGQKRAAYIKQLELVGCVVEEYLDAGTVYGVSAQAIITPTGTVQVMSTHEKLPDTMEHPGVGLRYPVRKSLRDIITTQAEAIGKQLYATGSIGPFAVYSLVLKQAGDITAFPVTLRMGEAGTTQAFEVVRMLANASQDAAGILRDANGKKVYYHSFEQIAAEQYKEINPEELIHHVRLSGLEFDTEHTIGVALHSMGGITKHGSFGALCISRSPIASKQLAVLLRKAVDNYVASKQVVLHSPEPEVQRDRLVQSFIQLAKISSPSGEEQAVRMVLREELVKLGCKVRFDKTGNLIAKRPGVGKVPFLLSAHMDTVQPCDNVQPVIRGDEIMTDGRTILGADNKAGLAYILEALRVAKEYNVPLMPLEIVFTVQEETSSIGAHGLEFSKLKSPYGLVIDGAAIGTVDYTAPYIAVLDVVVTGKTAHSGAEPENGISAVQIMARAVHNMKLGRVDSNTTANIGLVSGGSNRNAIPGQVLVHGEVRSISKRKLEDQLERMIQSLEDAAEKFGGLLNITSKVVVQGYAIPKNHKHIKHIMNTMKQSGIDPHYRQAGGASDANVFINTGIMAIDVGTGVKKPHTKEEHININDMVQMTEFVLDMVRS